MKKILVVVDYQNDFVSGALGFEKAALLEEKILSKIAEYRIKGDEVAFTFDSHGEDYAETQEGRNLPVAHCIKGSQGWRLYGAVENSITASDKCFEKASFGSMELAQHLISERYDSVEFVGLVSNICVITNAVLAKTALPEALIIVDASATASYNDKLNSEALNVMEGMQIKVINRSDE